MTRSMTVSKKPASKASAALAKANTTKRKPPTRLDQLQGLLTRESGASIAEMCDITGWQQHSVRGALAGALKKRGLAITSEKTDGVRRYYAKASS
ncbi:DUF3489 domain-containing protein [Altererythrobacter sp. GH1-8]|uniref:DUF3489 domain-containing protein n=1 Tax=Altererythrobacter sp. GH1-8 TaxID=3349333 RepID=UPI00374DBDF0